MNIFVLSECPVSAARLLDDRRVSKMALESAQMICTIAIHSNLPASIKRRIPYKATHKNHPCTVWARQSKDNFLWLLQHYLELSREYYFRCHKKLKCAQYESLFTLVWRKLTYPKTGLLPFANSSRHSYPSVVRSYRATLKEKWSEDRQKTAHFQNPHPRWTRRNAPSWSRFVFDLNSRSHILRPHTKTA